MAVSALEIKSTDRVLSLVVDPGEPFFHLQRLLLAGDLRVTINQRVKGLNGLPLRFEVKLYPDRAVCEMVWIERETRDSKPHR
jgi:hypothetical protein